MYIFNHHAKSSVLLLLHLLESFYNVYIYFLLLPVTH